MKSETEVVALPTALRRLGSGEFMVQGIRAAVREPLDAGGAQAGDGQVGAARDRREPRGGANHQRAEGVTMSEEKDKPTQPDKPQDKPPEPRMTHEQLMAKLRADPRFVVHEASRTNEKQSGESFIIAGQNPAHPKPK